MSRSSFSSTAVALLVSVILATVSLVMAAAPAHAQVLMQRNISVAQAMAVVDGVIESCGRNGALVTVTIMIGDEPIGGVGVSGAVGGQPADEACAMAGVAAIADQLQ